MISGAFVFQSLTLHPTANPVEPSRKPDPFTITPVVRPLKTPSVAFWRKNAKDKKTPAKPENASESFSGRCITMHESDVRSVSCVLNTERLKTTSFLPGAWRSDGVSCFQTSHLARQKTDLGSVARIRVYGKYFSYRMLNIHKRKNASVMP